MSDTNGNGNGNGDDFAEKRTHTRHKVSKDVRVEVDGEVVVGETSDISLSGVAVNTLVEMSTEQFVKLHLAQVGDLTGEIVRETEEGFAVEFDTVEDNGSVLENKLRTMMGNGEPTEKEVKDAPKEAPEEDPKPVDPMAEERARMEAHLLSMLGGDDDDD